MHHVPTRKIVSQACDACRRRKIKCNGLQPCPGCLAAALDCTFIIPQKRGGHYGARARVLNELRGIKPKEQQPASTSPNNHTFPASPVSPSSSAQLSPLAPSNNGRLETIAIDVCIDAYLQQIYPVIPFLNLEILQNEVQHASISLLSRQFVAAFCAYVVTFGNVLDKSLLASHSCDQKLGEELLEAALRIHNPDRTSSASPSAQSIFISFFLYGAYAGMGNYRQGWFYLREATTLLSLHGRPNEASWFTPRIYGRLFWVLVVSERSHGIRRNRPITVPVTPESPPLNEPEELGLSYLASIFRPFDEIFFAVWNGSTQDCGKTWLLDVERAVRTALPPTLHVSNEQIANLRVSQLWLQVKLWELFPRFGFLSSESVYECLTFSYPIVLARQLAILAMKLPIGSLQIHGVGMTEKIFDIACALADVLPFISITASQMELGPVDYLTQTTSLLTKLPGGSTKFVPLLLAKVDELLPELVQPLCEAIEMNMGDVTPLSPDSRFLYEEEVRGSLYTDLRNHHSR